MLKNYTKIAWRNLWKSRTFSFINIIGLAVGIAGSLLIIFHIKNELSYDSGFSKGDRIYRITNETKGQDVRHWAATAPPLAPALQRAFPQVEKIARFHRLFPYQLLSYSNPQSQVRRFEEKGGFFANADVVDIFDVPFVSGNPAQALKDANSIVITEKMAEKYFGKSEPMGKIIQDDRARLALKVTGVVKEFDFPSHLHFDYLVSMPTIERYLDQRSLENIGWSGFYNYILLKDADSKSKVEAGLSAFTTQFYAPSGESAKEILAGRELHLQPVKDIHLHSKLEKEMSPNSDITYIYIFAIAALFILLVAAVNFINISTALAFNRMKEIGLRKVVGATKPQLVRQFLAESLMVTLLATGLAILLFKVSIPFYAQLTSGAIAFSDMFTPANLGIIAIMIIAIAGFAGMYPAWFVARFNPVTSLKGKKLSGQGVNLIRKGLIVFQFSVSVFMIFSTVIIYRQMQLFHNQDLGFNKDQVIAVTMYDQMWEKYGVLVNEMSKKPQISNFSVISTLPGERFGNYSAAPLHQIEKGATPENARMLWSDEKTLATLGVAIKDGRGFTSQFPEIKNPEFILNESAVKAYHLQNPVGEAFVAEGDTGKIVGVVKDFNFASLHSTVEPLVIQYNPRNANYLLVKVKGSEMSETISFLENQVKTLSPNAKFTYTFIDQQLNMLYASENRMSQVFEGFAVLSIFISCLGLFGLSAYSAKLRTKEVGVRKVLGASVAGVTFLLSRDFVALVLIAIFISLPLGWWAVEQWLDTFAYRIHVDFWTFAISGLSALLLAMVTISFQTVKTALLNPVKNLSAD